ncbi:hypothetical protein BGW38_004083, partial [Lunasporangiospora selenospora]
CRLGMLSRVHRRLSDIERQSVRSGSVYCFDEREAGMRRWTDGKSWSPSRVTGSFLTYRELDDSNGQTPNKNLYRPGGLFKQSFSITTSENQKLHLISYYTTEDLHSERLKLTPSQDPCFAEIVVPKGVYPETSTHAEQIATAPTISQSSPSPPMTHRTRQRPHHRAFQQQDDDNTTLRVEPKTHRRTGSSSSTHSNGHRRTNSGSALKEHRYSPMYVPEGKHASRSRSNSNVTNQPLVLQGPLKSLHGHYHKSNSPGVPASFPTPPSHAYSPGASSWISDDDQPGSAELISPESMSGGSSTPVMIPPLRELPPIHQGHESKVHDRFMAPHEQDSLSVLATLATHSLLLPKLEPQEISREKTRWVEDDRQLRALSSMLRL